MCIRDSYVAERDPEVPADLECPGMESAEIHSMAMEFLTAPVRVSPAARRLSSSIWNRTMATASRQFSTS